MNFLWLFFTTSFIGWILETVTAAFQQKKFLNRGAVNAPFCVLYGSASVFITIFCQELESIWLFAGATILATIFEWVAGHLIERLYQEKWWDYSEQKWNLDGYICIKNSLIWGILSYIMIKWGNTFLLKIFHLLSEPIRNLILIVLTVILTLDIFSTVIVITRKNQEVEKWKKVDQWLSRVTLKLSDRIYGHVQTRMEKAYPKKIIVNRDKENALRFSEIFLLFVIGSFLGDLTETLYCRIAGGVWMSRSSLVWGPFSIVWGLGIAAATLLLYRYQNKSDSFLFWMGAVLGGVYEYICSVFTEIAFGKIFWEYSHMPFNLGGRINLLYCFFWGIAAVAWMKYLYPKFSAGIKKLSAKVRKNLTIFFVVFMCCNMLVSSMALIRSSQRENGVSAESGWQKIMDERFDDERLAKIYPNMIQVD